MRWKTKYIIVLVNVLTMSGTVWADTIYIKSGSSGGGSNGYPWQIVKKQTMEIKSWYLFNQQTGVLTVLNDPAYSWDTQLFEDFTEDNNNESAKFQVAPDAKGGCWILNEDTNQLWGYSNKGYIYTTAYGKVLSGEQSNNNIN